MPNWCLNTVVFTGGKGKLTKLKRFFTDLRKKELKKNQGQLPEFFKESPGFFFEIRWEDGVLYYDTKWGPNVDVLQAIAEHFIVDFNYEYAEPNMQIYGECTFIKGVLNNISLDLEDFDRVEFKEKQEVWLFECKEYEIFDEIAEILIDRKKGSLL